MEELTMTSFKTIYKDGCYQFFLVEHMLLWVYHKVPQVFYRPLTDTGDSIRISRRKVVPFSRRERTHVTKIIKEAKVTARVLINWNTEPTAKNT